MSDFFLIGIILDVIVFVFQNLTLKALLCGIVGGVVVTLIIFAIWEFLFNNKD